MPRKLLALCSGLVCHVSFAIALLTMMAAMYFGMSRSLGRVPEPWNWVVNAVLLIQFPVVHSLLLTGRGRKLLARLAPLGAGATLSATTYATTASFGVFALFALWSPTGVIWWQAHGAALAVMTALYAGSWSLLGKSLMDAGLALQTGALGWFALLRGRRPVYPPMPESGLFRFTRQPIYVAFTLTLWTVPTWTPDQLVVAVALTAYCLIAPKFKEARFRRIYGREFDRYAGAVPYWLPWPRPRRGPRGSDLAHPTHAPGPSASTTMRAALKQLANHQQRPALIEQFHRLGHLAELSVSRHRVPLSKSRTSTRLPGRLVQML